MSDAQVLRLAKAFALANGHTDADTYAASVLEHWKALLQEQGEPEKE